MRIKKLANWFMSMPRIIKQIIMASSDAILLIGALWAAFSMRLGVFYFPQLSEVLFFLMVPLIAIPVFTGFKLYRAIIRFIGIKAISMVFYGVTVYAAVWGVVAFLFWIDGFPRSVALINWMVSVLFVGGSRMVARSWLLGSHVAFPQYDKPKCKVLIYGAGASGIQTAMALAYSKEYIPAGFIDDDVALQGRFINSLPVYPLERLQDLIENRQIREVLLAMPSVLRSKRCEIIKKLEVFRVRVKTLPGLADLADGKVKVEDIKDIDLDDLLGRERVEPLPELIHANILNKVVMVTGAGGSIGSELCRQILKYEPKTLLLFEQNEYALYTIEHELTRIKSYGGEADNQIGQIQIVPFLGTVCDRVRLEMICSTFGVQSIYHAAAYKHVPMVEKNPVEAVHNNIFGTLSVAEAAINSGVDTFVLVSTDKAVRPTNTMGATKRFAELILQGLSRKADVKCRFTMVRFGNVMGSSGSVIPLFRKQIKNGGPVTVTDLRMTRYFMTIPEAAELVIQAGALGTGGDVFVLDMGTPIKIVDLATRMIRLSGLEVRSPTHPNGDIEIMITGIRPGEKLYEELLIGEKVLPTVHPLIMREQDEELDGASVKEYLAYLSEACAQYDQHKIRDILCQVVGGFNPQCGIEDHLYKTENHLNSDLGLKKQIS